MDELILQVAPYFDFNEVQLFGGILFGVGILVAIYARLKPGAARISHGAWVGAAGVAIFVAGFFA